MLTVFKRDHNGHNLIHYPGEVLERGEYFIQLKATFQRKDHVTPYHTFRFGDTFIEWFYGDRWYNIFQMHDVDDNHLKGWYCNICRPAILDADAIYCDDLALDVMIYPDGRYLVLDEDEFEALGLDKATRDAALEGLQALLLLVEGRQAMFAAIPE